jgi:membrane protein DedA with SNARE-associated domain
MTFFGISFEQQVAPLITWLQTHQELIAPVVFVIAFAECSAVISLLVPATAVILAISVFAGAANLSFFPLAVAATFGAGTGFWVSYWLGLWLGPRTPNYWPFKKNPEYLDRGHAFFEKWGVAGVFLGHFFGPVRAVIALVAGICQMPFLKFQLANWAASFVWGFGFFYGGGLIGKQASLFGGP